MEALPGALVAEGEVLGGYALGVLKAAGRPLDQEADLGEADPQEPGAEPVFPGAHDSGDRPRIGLVGRRLADQRQDVFAPCCRDQPDPGGRQRPEGFDELPGAERGVSGRGEPGELL